VNGVVGFGGAFRNISGIAFGFSQRGRFEGREKESFEIGEIE
jgi:hypothetical protein